MSDKLREAQKIKKEWEESMGIGSLDKMAAVLSGEKLNYDEADFLGGMKPEDHHVDLEAMEDKLIKAGSSGDFIEKNASSFKNAHLTEKQNKAIEKYPSLIEMLGADDSNELSNKIAFVINEWIISKIHKNSCSINKNAVDCIQDERFIKQYYKFDNCVGCVKVSGSFNGSEYIQYDLETKQGYVFKKESGKFIDNSGKFNIESEFVAIPGE